MSAQDIMSIQDLSLQQPSAPQSGGSQFHLFKELPFELRRSIWKFCLPNRIVDIDFTSCQEDLSTACQGVGMTSLLNMSPPIITRVCKESRAVGFEGIDASLVGEDVHPDCDNFAYFRDNYWFNPSTDVIHLNWNPKDAHRWNGDRDPIAEFLRQAARGMGASLIADAFYPFAIRNSPSYPPFFFVGETPILEKLESQSHYLVTLETINLHVDLKDAVTSGLFGLLGEERVVLVRTDDRNLMQRYYKLWTDGPPGDQEPEEFFESSVGSGFFYRKVEHWQYELKVYWLRYKCDEAIRNGTTLQNDLDSMWYEKPQGGDCEYRRYTEGPGSNWSGLFDEDHPFAKKVPRSMPKFSPVVIFRLCEMKCHENSMK